VGSGAGAGNKRLPPPAASTGLGPQGLEAARQRSSYNSSSEVSPDSGGSEQVSPFSSIQGEPGWLAGWMDG
jgi:hypothetical protein